MRDALSALRPPEYVPRVLQSPPLTVGEVVQYGSLKILSSGPLRQYVKLADRRANRAPLAQRASLEDLCEVLLVPDF